MWGAQLVAALGNRVVVLAQEADRWYEDDDFRHWLRKSSNKCKAGVWVPKEVQHCLKWSSNTSEFDVFQYASGVLVADVGAVSAYFVHKNMSDEEFMKGVFEVRTIFQRLVSLGARRFSLGCDSNF